MKNTMRILSGLLTCLMVLSALPVFATTTEATSASTPEAFYVDFESFTVEPDVTKSTDSEWIAAGFNKGMAQNYNSISGNASSGFAAKVVEDDVLGKAWQTPGGTQGMWLGVGFDAPVTSGAVKLAFTMKASKENGFPFINYVQTMGTSYGGTTSKPYMGQIIKTGVGNQAFISGSSYGQATGTSASNFADGSYYDVEWIVDIDTDTRYLYVNGQQISSYTNEETKPIDQMQGFYIVKDTNNRSYATPMVDNILLTTYDVNSTTMNLVKTVNGDGKVKLVFDEVIDDTVTAADITFKEAGGTNNVAPSAIKVIGNTLEITFDASTATAGREYILTSDKLKSVNGAKGIEPIAMILKDLTDVKETITALDTYDDIDPADYVNTDTSTHKTRWNTGQPSAEFATTRIYPMIHSSGVVGNWGKNTNPVVLFNWDNAIKNWTNKTGLEGGHGVVLTPYEYTNYRLAYNVDNQNEYGVEVYEFDFATTDTDSFKLAQGATKTTVDTSLTTTKFNISYKSDASWQHAKLVYDTVNDTAQLFIEDNESQKIENVTNYHSIRYDPSGCQLDIIDNAACGGSALYSTWTVFDNFESYVLYTPLALEGARFVDKAGKDTISDSNIWAETTQIKVNFSEAVTEEAIEDITVTKADSEDDIVTGKALSEDGKTAILTVAGIVGSATYTINVPATVTTTASAYTFTTEPGKFEINDFALTNADGTPIAAGTTDAENGNSLKVTADITNSNGTNKDVTIIYALYSGTTLVDVNFKDIKITPTSGDIDEDFTTKKDVTFDSWKAFIWDGFDTAVPQIEAFSGGAIN